MHMISPTALVLTPTPLVFHHDTKSGVVRLCSRWLSYTKKWAWVRDKLAFFVTSGVGPTCFKLVNSMEVHLRQSQQPPAHGID